MLRLWITVVMVATIMGAIDAAMESLELYGSPEIGYYVELGLGKPYQVYNFLVDTGSSNLVIAGVKQTNISSTFDPLKSSTFVNNHRSIAIEYQNGGIRGYIGTDRLQFTTSLYISDVTVAIIEESRNFFSRDTQWQGILGLAFDSLMQPSAEVTNSVYTSLWQQHDDIADVFSLRLCPPLDIYGEHNLPRPSNLVLGGVDNSHYYGDIMYTPIVKKQYYNVLLSNISVGGVMIPLECSELNRDVTIVDSGTSEVFVNDVVFKAIIKLLKNYFKGRDDLSPPDQFWSGGTQLAWHTKHVNIYDVFPVIAFYFPLYGNSSMQFGVTMPPQLYLREVDTGSKVTTSNISCNGECNLFEFGIKSKPSGVILGNNLMNGYTVVFDRYDMRVGFAVTTCDLHDNTESHDQPTIIDAQPRDDSVGCSYHGDKSSKTKPYTILILTTLGIASVILITIVILYLLHCRHAKKSTLLNEMEVNEDGNHDNTADDHATVQPAQEAGSLGDQLQVGSIGLTTPTESIQLQCSSHSRLEKLINKKFSGDHYHATPVLVAESTTHGECSSLVGLQSFHGNLNSRLETVA